jgi:NAD(P)-dependent dehydrogenase (short-subunit alcohol dehydrogenase family)
MKTVLITGSSRGLGKIIVDLFLKNGWRVIGFSRSAVDNSENYMHTMVDISNISQVHSTFEMFRRTETKIDVLINNSAAFHMGDFIDMDYLDISQVIDTNVKGTMYVTNQALTVMGEGSKIVFVNSVAGLRDIQHQSVYCASKAALKSFAGVLGQELRQKKIKVSSIHPGGINTTLWNDRNPYPCGQATDALDPQSVANMIYHVSSDTTNTEYKTVTMFPEVEWH